MIREGLTFDDVLLVPQHSAVDSRAKVDLSINWAALRFDHPIIPANMQTITGARMAGAVIESGGLAILHRFMPWEEQIKTAKELVTKYGNKNLAVSIGVKNSDQDMISRFAEVGVRMVCIDIAHGDSHQCSEMVDWIKNRTEINPGMFVIAGNVATGEGARRLWEAGTNVVKVGVGPGSLCTTRIETGNGVPQLTALMDVAKVQREMLDRYRARGIDSFLDKRTLPFIADGGIKNAGDIVKALCFADMVMVGNIFAGCVETPGDVKSIDGRTFKEYVGSSTHKTNHVEGVAAIVPTKGRFEDILTRLLEGLQSGCSYQGAHSLAELKDNPEFIRITNAGLKESHPHDVILR
jgi:IMP dehydrogenase